MLFLIRTKEFLVANFFYACTPSYNINSKQRWSFCLLISEENFFDGEKMSNKRIFFADYDNDEISLPVDSI